ncbi:chitin synthase-domain-containing protein [Pisolithus orientalis]|uniref:chitin synthase-domain-containing protein n=1 Tax=Pisolithus orientalis TaxID=936130 RepID=UPI0022242812|nr:chitin synthase-domain-containing protein [Pisolithus orientalis]KAI6006352.1 chitin synthase-domain-containing protein [Pisolithus orientalis]
MIHDKKALGMCSETSLTNAKQLIVTMMQVYEYFISHHMVKAFESLFGSLTCLPSCFTLFCLHMPDMHNVSNQITQDYSQNLWMLMLRQLLWMIGRFCSHNVIIGSTQPFIILLCGFCCFSMHFIVMMDLPVTVTYIVYLIVLVIYEHSTIPFIFLVMIATVHSLQAFVFILHCKWDMVGWMDFYILAIPIFSFMLPIYSFWHMDDFSWGAHKIIVHVGGLILNALCC